MTSFALLATHILFPYTAACPVAYAVLLTSRDYDATTSMSSGYVKGPDGRGTLHPITSYLGNFLLCAWSAVHLSVPAGPESKIKETGRRIWWMIVAAAVPKFVLLRAARDLTKVINKIGKVQQLERSLREAFLLQCFR